MATQDQDEKMCDRCHERPATCHICHGNSSHEGESLCRECFELSNPTVTSGITKVWEAGCQYCGGPPAIGGGGFGLGVFSGIRSMPSCKCKPCAEEYYRFLQVKMPGFGTGTMTKEQLAKIKTYNIAAIFTEAEEHMKKWVSERGSQ
jgi:hypothetical protein